MYRNKNFQVLTFILRDSHFTVDDLGNYIAYKGIKDNVITDEDDLLVAQEKVYTQERWLILEGISDMKIGDWYIQYLQTSPMGTHRLD